MPLPSAPSIWTISQVEGDGTFTNVGRLVFQLGSSGAVSGTVFATPFVGFFDETSQTLKMYFDPSVTQGKVDPPTTYEGSFFQFTSSGTTFSVLNGVYGAFHDSARPWFAQNPARPA